MVPEVSPSPWASAALEAYAGHKHELALEASAGEPAPVQAYALASTQLAEVADAVLREQEGPSAVVAALLTKL